MKKKKIKIFLSGRIPSKKNSKIFTYKGNKPLLLSSKEYNLWHEEKSYELIKYKKDIPTNYDFCKIEMNFILPDNRKTDLTNKAESIMDLLVDNKFLIDDNFMVVPELKLKFMKIDKTKNGVEIFLNYCYK
jgi:Holliday junction resolvase RusA-like endonuclease